MSTVLTYTVGDRVTVTGHCVSGEVDAHGLTGVVTSVPDPTPIIPFYGVRAEDLPFTALLAETELTPAVDSR